MIGQLGDFPGPNMPPPTPILASFSKVSGRPKDMVKNQKIADCHQMSIFQ